MKKIFITLFIVLSAFACKSQNTLCVLIGDTIPIYNSDTSSTPILTLYNIAKTRVYTNDTFHEPFFFTKLIKQNQNRFLVNIFSSISDITTLNSDSVWICNENAGIGVIANRLSDNKNLKIYDTPDFNSTYRIVEMPIEVHIATVIAFHDDWLKIIYDCTDIPQITGWLSHENQCVNMYSMCMGN